MQAFEVFAGGVFVGEAGCGDVHAQTMANCACFVNYTIA
jgi:hypothetical protein